MRFVANPVNQGLGMDLEREPDVRGRSLRLPVGWPPRKVEVLRRGEWALSSSGSLVLQKSQWLAQAERAVPVNQGGSVQAWRGRRLILVRSLGLPSAGRERLWDRCSHPGD
jgi:hypothetical protein